MHLAVINKALFDRLKECTLCSVYDSVPDNTKRPYIVMAETKSTPWDSKTTKGYEVSAGVLIFSDYKGDKEINSIADEVYYRFSAGKLNLSEDLIVITQCLEEMKIERMEESREGYIKINLRIFRR